MGDYGEWMIGKIFVFIEFMLYMFFNFSVLFYGLVCRGVMYFLLELYLEVGNLNI